MRITVILLSGIGFVIAASAWAAEPTISSQDKLVLHAVLSRLLTDLVPAWQITPKGRSVVVSNRSIPPMFPASAEQEKKAQEIGLREIKGEKVDVDWSELEFGHPDGQTDFILPQGRVIPKEIILQMLARAKKRAKFPELVADAELSIVMEDPRFIEKTFRKNENREFLKKHPEALAVVDLSLPGYSPDEKTAGVYSSVFGLGFGGATEFYLVHHLETGWKVEWFVTVLLE